MPLRNRHSFWRAGIAVQATALLLFIGNGLNPVWQCVWVAPLPILLFAATAASWRLVAWAAALSMLLGSLSMLYYLHFALGAPIIAWLAPFSVASLLFAAGVLLYRELLRRNRVLIGVLSFPAMWSLCEYLASLSPANVSEGSLAYTQLSNLPIAQLASITGPWGITFVLLLLPAGAVAAAYLWLTARQQAIRVVCLVTGVLIAALLYGFLRLRSSSPEERIKVGLLATDSVNLAAGSTMQRLTASYGAQPSNLQRKALRSSSCRRK